MILSFGGIRGFELTCKISRPRQHLLRLPYVMLRRAVVLVTHYSRSHRSPPNAANYPPHSLGPRLRLERASEFCVATIWACWKTGNGTRVRAVTIPKPQSACVAVALHGPTYHHRQLRRRNKSNAHRYSSPPSRPRACGEFTTMCSISEQYLFRFYTESN